MKPEAAAALSGKAVTVGEDAGARVSVIVTGPVVKSAMLALEHAAADSGGGAQEAVLDIAQVRAELSEMFNKTAKKLNDQMYVDMLGALNLGYHDEITAQNEALPEALTLSNETTPDWLTIYPIVGNTAGETAAHNSRVWRFGAEGAVGVAASVGSAAVLPAKLEELAQRTASVAARATEEAYVAGQQAARRAIGAALQRGLSGN